MIKASIPNINCNGYRVWNDGQTTVYHHRKQASIKLGRKLKHGEVTHHIDEDRSNNKLSNLMVFKTAGDHNRFHGQGCNTANLKRLNDGSYICKQNLQRCKQCKKKYIATKNSGKYYCSNICRGLNIRKVERPSADELKILVWSTPTIHVAAKLGVSDKAIDKWCKSYGIEKPSRGYWNKIKAKNK